MKNVLLSILSILVGITATQAQPLKGPDAKPSRVVYDFNVDDTTVQYAGRSRHAIAINGFIPGPTLELTEGDTAVIRIHNKMKVSTSIHWHGILIPNQYDGVPGLTTFPIKAGEMLEVVFPVIQNGTYWYHSHSGLQEQIGLTGSIVIHKRGAKAQKQQVIVLNDWTNTKPHEVWRQLKRGPEWYEIRKYSVQSYGEAIRKGYFGDKLMQEWMRMSAMDIADVKYDQFHCNGAEQQQYPNYKGGDSIYLRIINASASSYFWLQYAGGKIKVLAADGQDVKPLLVDKFLIATAETYDIMVYLPANGQYELRATAQDVSGFTTATFGKGTLHQVPDMAKVNYFEIMRQMNGMMMGGMNMKKDKGHSMKMGMMKMNTSKPMVNMELNSSDSETGNMDMEMPMDKGHFNHDAPKKKMQHKDMERADGNMNMGKVKAGKEGMDMGGMDMGGMKMDMPLYAFNYPPNNGSDVVLDYKMLKAANNSTVPIPNTDKPDRLIVLTATGNMFRYVWSFNNTTLSAADKILIKKGEHVQVVFKNRTMMEHPMHLHGHFFRLRNGGNFADAPLKHTFNLLPMATDTLDFEASEEQDWFFHCHTLYHMMSGMARVFHYEGTEGYIEAREPQMYRRFIRKQGRKAFVWGNADVQTQGIFGGFSIASTRWQIDEEASWNWKKQYESETMLRLFVDQRQFLSVFVGTDNRNELVDGSGENGTPERFEQINLATAGLTYFLPMLIMAEGRIDHKGHLRLQLSRHDIAITRRARLNFAVNTDKEYSVGTKYILARNLAISGNYDSDYGLGIGLSFIY